MVLNEYQKYVRIMNVSRAGFRITSQTDECLTKDFKSLNFLSNANVCFIFLLRCPAFFNC